MNDADQLLAEMRWPDLSHPSKVGNRWLCWNCRYYYPKELTTLTAKRVRVCAGCHYSAKHGAVPGEEL